MRPDLLEAQAAIDWPMSRFVDLHRRHDAWLDEFVQIEVRDVPPPATHNPIVAVEREFLPLAFSVEVGAYINSLRSSLDVLASALVRRHGLSVPENRISFPIAESEAAYRTKGFKGREFLDALPAEDRRMINFLKPYKGGNDALWMLHHLDIVRKHRRILDVRIRPVFLSIQGPMRPDDFTPLATGVIHVNEETIIGLLRKGVAARFTQSRFQVAINEPDSLGGHKPVNAVLLHLATEATRVIKMFDV